MFSQDKVDTAEGEFPAERQLKEAALGTGLARKVVVAYLQRGHVERCKRGKCWKLPSTSPFACL